MTILLLEHFMKTVVRFCYDASLLGWIWPKYGDASLSSAYTTLITPIVHHTIENKLGYLKKYSDMKHIRQWLSKLSKIPRSAIPPYAINASAYCRCFLC